MISLKNKKIKDIDNKNFDAIISYLLCFLFSPSICFFPTNFCLLWQLESIERGYPLCEILIGNLDRLFLCFY